MDESDYAEMVVPDTEEDGDRDGKDFESRQTHKTGSTKSSSANMCGNTSKRRKKSADATESEVKKTSNRLRSDNDELTLFKAKQTFDELRKLKRKYQKMKSRMKERNLTRRDSHPQELLGASSKLWKENNGGIKSDELGKEGKKDDDFYPSLSGNTSKQRKKMLDARKFNTIEEKKTGKRIWSESDELLLLKGFGQYNSLHPSNETSFHSYIKDAISFNFSVDQLTHKLWKLKNKYEDTESRMKDGTNLSFVDSHQQKLFEASSQIWGKNSNWIRSEAKNFYHSLLSNYMADKGLDFDALDGATWSIFVEEWNNLMLARTNYLTLNAKFDKKVCKCRYYVYKNCINNSPTLEDS